MARELLTEKLTLAEDIVVKRVENQSQDDECHVTFKADMDLSELDQDEIEYFNEWIKQGEDGTYRLELWTMADDEESIKSEITDYMESEFGVTPKNIEIVHADLLRFVDLDELNIEAVKSLKDKLSGIEGISFPEEESTGFNYKMENGDEFWFECEVADAKFDESLESRKYKLNEGKYTELNLTLIENALVDLKPVRFNEAGILTEKLGWVIQINEKPVCLVCSSKPLKEDLPDAVPAEPIVVETEPEAAKPDMKLAEMSIVTNLLNQQYSVLDSINSAIQTLKVENSESKLIPELDDIANDAAVVIGRLQAAIGTADEQIADVIDQAKDLTTPA